MYKVSYNGKDYALKWYHVGAFKGKERDFYSNLENNIAKGAPTNAFLWPLGITEMQHGSFGYLMDIRPSGYEELTNFFVGSKKKQQVRFKSFEAISTAAINITQAFRELHNRGYSYQDINNGNFFIDPASFGGKRILFLDGRRSPRMLNCLEISPSSTSIVQFHAARAHSALPNLKLHAGEPLPYNLSEPLLGYRRRSESIAF